jgi:hypothetical protein
LKKIQSLKDTIRQLESALKLEKEFNTSDRKLNTEYLVNVLKRFLTTGSAEEKGKLAPVICSILRFNAEVSASVAKKWVVNRRGLVGWLLPLPPPESNDPDDVLYDPNKDGIGAYGSY